MVFEGFLKYGSVELVNTERARGITQSTDCPLWWVQGPVCEGLREVLGDEAYTHANIPLAPWYDLSMPDVSGRFLGVVGLSIEGLDSSTRSAPVTEGIQDGGTIGRGRKAARRARVRATLIAKGRDALDYGTSWLTSALDASRCGQHDGSCGTTDMEYFTECPPVRRDDIEDFTEWEAGEINLITNPSFEKTDGTVEVFRNLATNPSFETDAGLVELRRNLAKKPRATDSWLSWPGSGGNGTLTYLTGSGMPDVTEFARLTQTVPGTGAHGVLSSRSVPAAVVPGVAYSLSIRGRTSSSDVTRVTLETKWFDAALAQVGPTVSANHSFQGAGVWHYLKSENMIAPAGAVFVQATAVFQLASPSVVGDTFDGTASMVEAAPKVGPYFDGLFAPESDFILTPAWTGASNASESILQATVTPGLPGYISEEWAASGERSLYIPELNDVAGEPAGLLEGPGDLAMTGFQPLGDRILYSAVDIIDQTPNYDTWAFLGSDAASGGIRHQTHGSGQPNLSPRFDFAGGDTNQTFSMSGLRHDRAVIWSQTAQGMTKAQVGSGPALSSERNVIPGTGMPASPNLRIVGATFTKGVMGLAYRSSHTEITRAAVLRWMDARLRFITLADQTFLITPRNSGQIVYFGGVEHVTTAGVPVRVTGTGPVGLSAGWWDEMLISAGAYRGGYFDGSHRERLRVNRALNPSFESGLAGWLKAGSGSVVLEQSTERSMFGSASMKVIALGGNGQGAYTVFRPKATAGETITSSIYINGEPGRTVRIEMGGWGEAGLIGGRTSSGNITLGEGWQRISVTAVMPEGTTSTDIVVRTIDAVPHTFYLDGLLVETGSEVRTYIDGSTGAIQGYGTAWDGVEGESSSYLYDMDLAPAWLGTADASVSVLRGDKVATTSMHPSNGMAALRSRHWSTSRDFSLRVTRDLTGLSRDSFAEYRIPVVAGKVYRISATGNASEISSDDGSISPLRRRTINLYGTQSAVGPTELASPPVPVGAIKRVSIAFVAQASATLAIRLYNGSARDEGGGDMFWDDLMVTEGLYEGPYFDGDTVASDPGVERFTWTGEEDASTSLREARIRFFRTQTDEEYAADIAPLRRFMHDVGVISGPIPIEHLKSQSNKGYYGVTMEWTIASERAWVYSLTRPVQLPVTPTMVVDDTPYNLAPYPSAELAGDPMVAATNYSTNPSVETNANNWGSNRTGDITIGELTAGRVVGELAAVGNASYRSVFTATGAGAAGAFYVQQSWTDISARPAGSRVSVSMWAAEVLMAGSATRSPIEFVAIWAATAGGASIRIDNLGTAPVNGGFASVKSIQPPAGANFVAIRATAPVQNWSAGTVIRLYADAVAVTVP